MMQTNVELEQAWEFVEHTGTSVFLTGKAGTGKTTFLRNVVEKSQKRLVVVAPTGVAAINARGVTIHSFFQLPFSPYIPNTIVKGEYGVSKENGTSSERLTSSLSMKLVWFEATFWMRLTRCCVASRTP